MRNCYFSGETEEAILGIESKVMLSQDLTIVDEGSLGSTEEQNAVDHLSSQNLLDAPDNEVQYAFRSADGSVTYRVLQVEDGMESLPLVSASGFSTSGVPQVLTNQTGTFKGLKQFYEQPFNMLEQRLITFYVRGFLPKKNVLTDPLTLFH